MTHDKCPRHVAEQALATARNARDRRREASALADLGIMYLYEGDAHHAMGYLEDAYAAAHQLGDSAAESDVIGNLGLAAADAGQPERALTLLQRSLALARAAGDRQAEKAALDRLGLTHSRLHDPRRALTFFGQALGLAHEAGDWQHETELLWYVAIQYAALGQPDEAAAQGQEAINRLETRRKPQAAWFAHHLQAYRSSVSAIGPGGTNAVRQARTPTSSLEGETETVLPQAQPGPASPPAPSSRLLDMAFSAANSMAQFLGSGWKTSSSEARQQRLQSCVACEHHTGLRCRVCGCFTSLKARLAHEECPIGKWPT